MKLFEKNSIPNHVRIHTDSIVPPSIKRYDGVHTAPVSLATDMRLEGEGRKQQLAVDVVHTTQGSHKDFIDRGVVSGYNFTTAALPGVTGEMRGWVDEGGDGGAVSVLALFRPDDTTERGVADERIAQRWCAHDTLVSLLPGRWHSTCSLVIRLVSR